VTQRQNAAEAFSRIVVIVTRQIGDVLLTTPLIRATRERWPRARIDVLGFAGTLSILAGNPDVDECIEVQAGAGWRQSWPLIRRLWRSYDLALIAQYTDRAHLYGWLSARVRSGQVPAGPEGRWKRAMLHHAVDLDDHQSHVVLEKLRLLSPWVTAMPGPEVVPPQAAPLPEELAALLGSRPVVLHVPSLVNYKQWPLPSYATLARALLEMGWQVVLTGGPSREDRAIVTRMLALMGDAANLPIDACGQLNFNQMSTLLSGAALYVGPDTSVTHLAAACGTPLIALFGPINPQLWGPWPRGGPAEQPYASNAYRQSRSNVILLQSDLSCVPCNGAGCDKHPGSRSECLETMTVERVVAEALQILRTA